MVTLERDVPPGPADEGNCARLMLSPVPLRKRRMRPEQEKYTPGTRQRKPRPDRWIRPSPSHTMRSRIPWVRRAGLRPRPEDCAAEETMAYDLAIVLPTFNESGNVGLLIDRLAKPLAGIRYEVIFVDDDSPDGTADVVRRLAESHDNVRVLQRIGRRGLASACIEGILAASAPYV